MKTALALLALPFLALTAIANTPDPAYPEPVPAGCQDLGAKPARPIRLSGKIFANYLPDGKRYTKLKEPSPPDYFELGVLDLDRPGSPIQRLTNDLVSDAEVAISPDHKKIVWSQRPALDYFDGANTIVIANPDLTERKVLATGPSTYMGIPTFAKTGRPRVMFSAQGDGDKFAKLRSVDLETGEISDLRTSFQGSISDPELSPDGKKLVFKSFEQKDTEDAQLYLMNADGTNVKRLTKNDYKDEDPVFSPDGRTIAFERMYGGSDHKTANPNDWFFKEGIVSLDLKTGKETALTVPDPCGKNELWLPTWSPDGELIMFTRGLHLENGEFTHDLWVMRKDGSDLQRVPGSEGIMFFDWM